MPPRRPMLSNSQLEDRELWQRRTFEGRQVDPTAAFKKSGTPYFRRGHDRVLGPDSFMPVGEHAGKHLRAVPLDYLLWVDAQPWALAWNGWAAVRDFIGRYITPDPETAGRVEIPAGPVIFTDRLRVWPTTIKCFKAGSSHLHCLPGHEDLLHAFTVGALHLSRDWFQPQHQNKERRASGLPHYDLTVGKHHLALKMGAVLITDEQMIENKATWDRFRASAPKFIQE